MEEMMRDIEMQQRWPFLHLRENTPCVGAEMLDLAARILLLPVLAFQAANVRRSALHLADPVCRRDGLSEQGPVLRLLIIGDSSAAGVGTSHQEQALLGQMRKRLSQTNAVYWTVGAKTGATTTDTIARQKKSGAEVRCRFNFTWRQWHH